MGIDRDKAIKYGATGAALAGGTAVAGPVAGVTAAGTAYTAVDRLQKRTARDTGGDGDGKPDEK